MLFTVFLAVVAVIAAGIASVTGFGIGSLLTPTLAMAAGTKLAVAAISIPHLVGTAQRFWILRAHVHRPILLGFGIASAVGGLGGALVHTWISSRTLSIVFGIVVALAGVSELTGWMRRVRWWRRSAWIAGAASGTLGGMVGNQGGIRTAALLGFDVPKESFIATSTAIGLFVDAARMPVYLTTEWREIARISSLVVAATLGVVIGTAVGTRLLTRVPEQLFRKVVAVLLIVLGVFMAFSNH